MRRRYPRAWIALLFFVGILVWCGAPVRADGLPDVASLRANIDRAQGPEPANYREVVTGASTEGDIVETTLHLGDDWRTIVGEGPTHSEYGHYQGEDWHQDANGLTIADTPDDEPKEKVTTTVRRVATPIDAFVIEALDGKGYGTRDYVDPVTYYIVRNERIAENGVITTDYRDFAAFGSQMLPTHWSEKDDVARTATDYTRTSFRTGGVTSQDVAQTQTRRLLVEFPPTPIDVVLPVRQEDSRFYVRVNIGGRGLDFLLDTGASSILIERSVAESLGLSLSNDRSVVAAQRFTSGQTVVPEMTIGPLVMHNIVVDTVPGDIEQTDYARAVGLLGFDFIAQLGLTIDYEHGRVTATPANEYLPPQGPGVIPVDLRLGEQTPSTTVLIDGVAADRFIMDTGAGGTFLLFDYFVRRNPTILRGTCVDKEELEGVGGTFDTDVCRISHLVFGHVDFRDFHGYRVSSAQSYAYHQDGLIGTNFLSLFTIGLDYTNARAYLTPNASGRSAGLH